MADREQLRLFEGHDVEGVTYRVGGPIDVDLAGMEYEQKVILLVEVECEEVAFGPLSKKEPELGLARRHTLKVNRAMVYPDEFEAQRILEGLADAIPPGDAR